MAKKKRTADDIDAMADGLMRVVHMTRDLAKKIRTSDIGHVELHGDDVMNKHVPQLTKWVEKASLEARFQIEGWDRGRKDRDAAAGPAKTIGQVAAGKAPKAVRSQPRK